jgi:hypothetical protein
MAAERSAVLRATRQRARVLRKMPAEIAALRGTGASTDPRRTRQCPPNPRTKRTTERRSSQTTDRDGAAQQRMRLHDRAPRMTRRTVAAHPTTARGGAALPATGRHAPNRQPTLRRTNRNRRAADPDEAARRRTNPGGPSHGITPAGAQATQRTRTKRTRRAPDNPEAGTKAGSRGPLAPTARSWNATRTGGRLR